MSRTARRFGGLALAGLLVAAATPAALGWIDSLTLDPEVPICAETFEITLEGAFQDLCWELIGIEFIIDGSNLEFVITGVDHALPDSYCQFMELEYGAQETVGPLPGGTYTLSAREEITSIRVPEGDTVSFDFTVECGPVPGPVTGLRVETLKGDGKTRFTWTDVPGATEYTLYVDDAPGSNFATPIGTATTGVTGIDLEMSPPGIDGLECFLVAARNVYGEGPKR